MKLAITALTFAVYWIGVFSKKTYIVKDEVKEVVTPRV